MFALVLSGRDPHGCLPLLGRHPLVVTRFVESGMSLGVLVRGWLLTVRRAFGRPGPAPRRLCPRLRLRPTRCRCLLSGAWVRSSRRRRRRPRAGVARRCRLRRRCAGMTWCAGMGRLRRGRRFGRWRLLFLLLRKRSRSSEQTDDRQNHGNCANVLHCKPSLLRDPPHPAQTPLL